MSNHKERDERARRALDEARSLIENPPDCIFRRAYLDKKGAPEFATPEPEPEPDDLAPEQRHAQPAAATDAWEDWISARIDAALIVEREAIAEIMAEAIGRCMARERRELHAQLAELKREKRNRADEAFVRAMKHFEELVELEKNRILDLPALPAHRGEMN